MLDQPVDKTWILGTREEVCNRIKQITPYFLCGSWVSYRVALCSILRNENKLHLNLFSLVFRSVEGAQRFIVGFIVVFSRVNRKPQWSIRAKKDISCLDTAEFIEMGCSLRDMNKDESKVKVGIDYGKSFLKVSSNGQLLQRLNCFRPLRRTLFLSSPVRKGLCFKHWRHT